MPSQKTLRTINAVTTMSTALAGNAPTGEVGVISYEDAKEVVPNVEYLAFIIASGRCLIGPPAKLKWMKETLEKAGAEFPRSYTERRTEWELGGESLQFLCIGIKIGASAQLVSSSRPGEFSFFSTDGGQSFSWLDRKPEPPAPVDGRPAYVIAKEGKNSAVDALPSTGVLTGYTALCEYSRSAGEMRYSSWTWYGGKKLPISKDPATRIGGSWDPMQGNKYAGGFRISSWGTSSTWYLVEGTNCYIREGWFTWL